MNSGRKTPNVEKPSNIDDFIAWARETLEADFSLNGKTAVFNRIRTAYSYVVENPFFEGLSRLLSELQERIRQDCSYELLMLVPTDMRNVLNTKSFESVVNKAYRENVLSNQRFPEPPGENWVTPSNLFSEFSDLIRCQLVCRYKDGPQLLAQELKSFADQCGLKSRVKALGRDVGYYAYHFFVEVPVEFTEGKEHVEVEIQLTTQLQDVLYDITHQLYEKRRLQAGMDADWKWDIESNQFKASYLAHSLHFMEAVIVELRNQTTTETGEPE